MIIYEIYKVYDWAAAYDQESGMLIHEDHDVDRYVLEDSVEEPIMVVHYAYHDELEEYIQEQGGFPEKLKDLKLILNEDTST